MQVSVNTVLAALEKAGSKKVRDGYARYGIVATKAFGVPMGTIQKLAKTYSKNHELAAALWDAGVYEPRMMTAYVEEPARVTPATDERNFVKKGVSWAPRVIGIRDHALHAKVIALATKLAKHSESAARWIGKDVLRDLERPLVAKRLAAKRAKATARKSAPAKQRKRRDA